MNDLTELTIKETARLLRLHSFSAAELVTAHVDRIERLDRRVKAFLRFTPELWEKQAEAAEPRRPGDRNQLAGLLRKSPDGGEADHAARDRVRDDAAHLAVPWFRD